MNEEILDTGELITHSTKSNSLYRWAGEAQLDGRRDAVAIENEWHGITLNVMTHDIIDGEIVTKAL